MCAHKMLIKYSFVATKYIFVQNGNLCSFNANVSTNCKFECKKQ